VYLKRLDVHGFKSFANKTQMHFAPGVTCIIGPNGCGKTNVADSIRWVLGEHASRTLRARKTEDVIFAGSDKRAPMGVAEVSIALDNSKHWLPIEFDEVVVSRRAYRSGENEYLINGSKVRLRDVVELFMRAQVGQNSYAFMGQGMVEQVLSLRPEDRRALIEEAADVRIYRQKLDDASKKLKETSENVERVRMLVREIEPRINQLERQAGRAVKYRELAQELAASLHVYYEHQWRDVNDQVLAAITTHDQRTQHFEQAQQDAHSLADGLAQLRNAIEERRDEVASREAALRNIEDYARDLEKRVALDTERGAMLAKRTEELRSEITALKTDLAALEAETQIVDTAEQEARLSALREDLEGRRVELSAVEREIVALQRSALAHEQKASRASLAVEDLERRMDEAAEAIARLQGERDAAIEDRHKLENEAVGVRSALEDAQREASSIDAEGQRLRAERDREARAAAGYREQEREAAEALRDLNLAVKRAEARLEVLEELDLEPQAPDAGIHAVLEAAGLEPRELTTPDLELHGVVGRVGQVMRVPSGLERAIEAALAENLHAIVFEREADMQAAVHMLVTNDYGRATMYALDAFQEQRPLHLMKERGVIGVASGMVRCEGRYRKLVDTLLGRTVVVENIDIARRYVRRGLAGAVATLDGVLVRPIGSVAAGAASTIRTAMSYQRDLGELPEEITRLQPEIARQQSIVTESVERQRDATARVEALSDELDRHVEFRRTLDARLAAAETNLANITQRVDSLITAASSAEQEISRLQASQSASSGQAADLRAAATAAAEREREERARLTELDVVRTSVTVVVAELAAQVAQLDGAIRAEHAATQGERLAVERLQRTIATKGEQYDQAASEAQTVGARLAADVRELETKTSEIATMRADLEPARQEMAQLESRERSMMAQLAESSEKMRSAERDLLEAEAGVRQRRDELETLRNTLETEGFISAPDGSIERQPEERSKPERAATIEVSASASGEPPSWMRSDDSGDLPPVRGGAAVDVAELRDRIAELRGQIRGLGPINEEAASEYGESRERYDYLTAQLVDLGEAEGQLQDAIAELDKEIRDKFRVTFKLVNTEFERYFSAFFRGGTARLELGEADEDGLPGIEIYAQPPGKKLGSLALLSGGERSLTAVALLFALLQANPSPICVLDEVDAALDEANVGRFVEELRALSEKTQFIIITHNRRTIENADTIYGVSMAADSVSRVLSLQLDQVQVAAD
jgi:chromosome segregation protein